MSASAHALGRFAIAAGVGAAVFLLVWNEGMGRGGPIRRMWANHVARLKTLALPLRNPQLGATIARLQVVALTLSAVAFGLGWLTASTAGVVAAAALLAPDVHLRRAARKRIDAIERDLSGFLTALSNSLRATPSIGKALSRLKDSTVGPLSDELGRVMHELQLGASVEEALENMSARVGSPPLDAALTGIRIGRRIGGNLPDILEETANTLREMERLHGLVRAKTAEGKGQVWVIAVAPPLAFFAFDRLSPGYFSALTDSSAGWTLLIGSCALWVGSIVLAKAILTVDI